MAHTDTDQSRIIGGMARDVSLMLERFPSINSAGLAERHPVELSRLGMALSHARTALVNLEEVVGVTPNETVTHV